MPELPEVETIINRLKNGSTEHPPLPGHIIQSVTVTWDRIIAEPDPQAFCKLLESKEILDARRRGKFLHFPLNKGHLIGHLRMSGDIHMEKRLTLKGEPIPPQKHDRIILNLTSPFRLTFNNIRKFGRMWYVENPQSVFGKLGPEPLSADFTTEQFYDMLHNHHRQIKPLLMNQHFIAGLGNIYTDESLFKAKIHPLRQSDSLSTSETEGLYHAIRDTLQEGIRQFGASLDWVYRGGKFQNYFHVYQRDGDHCLVCGTILKKIIVGQRSTHFCPNCQKTPRSTYNAKKK